MEKLITDLSVIWSVVQEDERLFWMVSGVLTVVALLLLLLVLLRASSRKRRQHMHIVDENATTFVPIDADKDTAEIFLPLADKLVLESTNMDAVSPELVNKIREQKPGSLADILLAMNKVKGSYRDDLRRIIGAEQMMLAYAHSLGQAEYQPYTLASAWHECPDPTILPAFVELLASREEAVQMAAVRLLIALNEPQSLTFLASALLQPHRYVPARVAEILVAMGESAAWLLCYLLSEIPSESKPLVLSVLGQMQPGYPLEQVVICLRDPNEQVRRAAATALGENKALAALNELYAATLDSDWSVRAAVAKALGQIGEPAALPYLNKLTTDEVWMVGINAREAVRSLEARQKTG